MPHRKPILISAGPFSQRDVEHFAWALKANYPGQWIAQDRSSGSVQVVTADTPLDIPLVRVSPGLAPPGSGPDDRAFVLIVQGRSASSKAKVIVRDNLDHAATSMMFEALNGYSIVFSAAFMPPPSGTFFEQTIASTKANLRKVTDLSKSWLEESDNLLC